MPTATVPQLLHELVDDAALFPPGNAPMPDALISHEANRGGAHAGLLGPFLCPASRIVELCGALAQNSTLRLGLIVDTGVDGLQQALTDVAADERLQLEIVEIPLPVADLNAAAQKVLTALPEVTSYVELPRAPGWEEALELLAKAGRGAKLRTGGLIADAFPSEEEVADFMLACARRGVRFKCTAGLHNALRHAATETGFEHHGFLNILVAAESAARGADRAELIELLAQRNAEPIVAAYRSLGDGARELFASYGSCSFEEPVEDLISLGLLDS